MNIVAPKPVAGAFRKARIPGVAERFCEQAVGFHIRARFNRLLIKSRFFVVLMEPSPATDRL